MVELDRFIRKINLVLADGTRRPAELLADEIQESEGVMLYRITLTDDGREVIGTAEQGYFDAMLNLRSKLETENVLLECFGASEDMWPSPMQFSMGPAHLAYRMQMGRQAMQADIVDIFDAHQRVRPSTVEAQRLFHGKWLSGGNA
jgi:hypothetical protein